MTKLSARLDMLERSNRRWRYGSTLGLAALALAGALGAARPLTPEHAFGVPPGVQGVIYAHKFQLIANDGSPAGALVANTAGDGTLVLGDGTQLVNLTGHSLFFLDPRGPGTNTTLLVPGRLQLSTAGSYTPSIALTDAAGFETDIGITSLLSEKIGETHTTSAASIVMFGNDKNHNVIWQAPLP